MNRVDDVLERTLDLSCPEAVRVTLLDDGPLEILQLADDADDLRAGYPGVPDTPNPHYAGNRYPHLAEIRELVIFLLLQRAYPLWKRLVIVGHLSDKLNEMANLGNERDIPYLVQGYVDAIEHRQFDELLNKCSAQPTAQLITTVELIVSRITSDFTGRRFLDCYQEFMQGLQWTEDSTLEQIGRRYVDVYAGYYAPFMKRHDSLLERYLVTYVHKNLFPLGRLEINRRCGLHHIKNSICIQYMLMISYYAIIRTILIGLAGFHKLSFGVDQVIKVIQSSTKVFQHSTAFPAKAIEILKRNGIKHAASMAVLVQE